MRAAPKSWSKYTTDGIRFSDFEPLLYSNATRIQTICQQDIFLPFEYWSIPVFRSFMLPFFCYQFEIGFQTFWLALKIYKNGATIVFVWSRYDGGNIDKEQWPRFPPKPKDAKLIFMGGDIHLILTTWCWSYDWLYNICNCAIYFSFVLTSNKPVSLNLCISL